MPVADTHLSSRGPLQRLSNFAVPLTTNDVTAGVLPADDESKPVGAERGISQRRQGFRSRHAATCGGFSCWNALCAQPLLPPSLEWAALDDAIATAGSRTVKLPRPPGGLC